MRRSRVVMFALLGAGCAFPLSVTLSVDPLPHLVTFPFGVVSEPLGVRESGNPTSDFTATVAPPFSIRPGTRGEMLVVFAPTSVGLFSENIEVRVRGSILQVPITGLAKPCTRDADCQDAKNNVCDDHLCLPPVCGSDADCPGAACIDGSCAAPVMAAAVASCAVTPANLLVHDGSSAELGVVARDANGEVLPYEGAVSWSVDPATSATVTGAGVRASVVGGASTGALSLRAVIGAVECRPASGLDFASVPDGQARVMVADARTHRPTSGATVVFGDLSATTDATGSALFEVSESAVRTVSIFDDAHAYLTMFGVTSNDLAAYVEPLGSATATAKFGPRDFDGRADGVGTLHLVLAGSALRGSLSGLDVTTLLGPVVAIPMDLGTQALTLSFFGDSAIGLGEQFYRTDATFGARAGTRAFWAVGGNLDFPSAMRPLGPWLSGNTPSPSWPSVAQAMAPIGRTNSSVARVDDVTAGTSLNANELRTLDAPVRLHAVVAIPRLPTFDDSGATTALDGALVVAGALDREVGFVPLGLAVGADAAGLPDPQNPSAELPDGFIDPEPYSSPPGQLALRVAPAHDGLESARHAVVVLAAPFANLFAGRSDVVVAGLVAHPDGFSRSALDPTPISLPAEFLAIPAASQAGREFAVEPVSGATFQRLSIGTDARRWEVLIPPSDSESTFEIPMPPAGVDDRLAATAGDSAAPRVTVQAIALDDTIDYAGLVTFDGRDVDDWNESLQRFSTRELPATR